MSIFVTLELEKFISKNALAGNFLSILVQEYINADSGELEYERPKFFELKSLLVKSYRKIEAEFNDFVKAHQEDDPLDLVQKYKSDPDDCGPSF
jgi:hypothetical protein